MSSTEHRASVKLRGVGEAAAKRRTAALDRQRQHRSTLVANARRLAVFGEEGEQAHADGGGERRADDDDGMSEAAHEARETAGRLGQGADVGEQSSRQFYAQQLSTPEWMVAVPPDLRHHWYCVALPEGERCLVVASRGGTVSRRRNGSILSRFPSNLPNGNRQSQHGDLYCILDAVYHAADDTYYVLDVMCWAGAAVYDCNFEFRSFWLQCKLAECDAGGVPAPLHRHRLLPLPAYECSLDGLQAAYSAPAPFTRGGLLFYNKEGQYELGPTPLVLQWKDHATSNWFIDTDKDGIVLPQQQVVLAFTLGGALVTGDVPAVVMATLPASFMAQYDGKLRAGLLMKCVVGDQGMEVVEGQPVAADVRYVGLANQRRGGADSFTKILFQYAARHAPLTIETIVAVLRASPPAPPAVSSA